MAAPKVVAMRHPQEETRGITAEADLDQGTIVLRIGPMGRAQNVAVMSREDAEELVCQLQDAILEVDADEDPEDEDEDEDEELDDFEDED